GPTAFLSDQRNNGNSVAVISLGSNLVFKPQFGGATLPSGHTFLPSFFAGSAAALAASLTQHAGQLDLSVPEGEADSDLRVNSRSESLLVNVRHRFGDGLEVSVDGLMLRSRGQYTDRHSNGAGLITADSPANPFTNDIQVYFPISQMALQNTRHVETSRYTAGLLTDLPFGWRGTMEASAGWLSNMSVTNDQTPSRGYLFLTGAPSDLQLNPLGNWNAFQQAITSDPRRYFIGWTLHNQFRDQSLRLAGPVFSTAQGPATLTLQVEHRTEDVPTSTQLETSETNPM